MAWAEASMFEEVKHGNKPFAMRIPALLVSRGNDGKANFLTAMWFSAMGFEPSRLVVGVSKSTYTYGLLEETGEFVMTAPTRDMMDVVVFAGRISGRDVDKFEATGLTPVQPSRVSVPLIGEAIGNVEYRIVKQIPFDENMDLFVGEVLCAHMRKGSMEGELFREDAAPLLYLGTKYDENHKSLGKHYAHFSEIKCADYDSPLLKKYVKRR
jgi:flavin reductase (DIM6/NTAB) family NADH-FMN oxidoreductase RutF